MVNENLTAKTVDELQDNFKDLGIKLDADDTVLYCNTGVSATFGMLALEIAGAKNLRLYDGSWTEWGNDPATPKASTN